MTTEASRRRDMRRVTAMVALALAMSAALFHFLGSVSDSPPPESLERAGLPAPQAAAKAPADPTSLAARPKTPRELVEDGLSVAAAGRYRIGGELWMKESGIRSSAGRVTFQADWELAKKPGTDWVVGRLDDVRLEGQTGAFDEDTFGDLDAARGPYTFALRLSPTGEVDERRFESGTPKGVRTITELAIVGLKTVRPPEGAPTHAVRTEEVVGGAADVTYVDEDPHTLTKRWGVSVDAALASQAPQAGRSTLTLDALGIAVLDVLLVVNQDASLHRAVPLTYQVGFRAQAQRTSVGAAPWADELAPDTLLTGDQLEAEETPSAPPPAPTMRPLEDILIGTAAATQNGKPIERAELSEELQANVTNSLTVLGQVLTRLKTPGVEGDELRTLSEGLAFATSDAARVSYAKALVDPSFPRTARSSLLVAAAFVNAPSAELLAAVSACATNPNSDVRPQAALAWGAIASRQLTDDPPLGASIRDALLAAASPALTTSSSKPSPGPDTGMWLRGLGNLGGIEIWPLVSPWLLVEDRAVRRHALRALRFVPLTGARQAIAKAIREDSDPRNRRTAVGVAIFQPRAAMEMAVKRAMREDEDGTVRLDAAYTVASWGMTSPGLYAEINDAAEREINPVVRDGLLGLLPVVLKDQDGTDP